MLLNEILKIKYPIVQGAMANIATAEFAAAVSNAGALGVIATGAMNPQQVADAVARCRSLTDKPFGVNVMMMNHHSPEIFEVLYQLKPAVVTTGAGNPGPYMAKLKEAGIFVIPVVPTVSLAIRMQQAGAGYGHC
jgi:enoyl-[acyl-carrier protein] reductase II